MAQRKPEDRGTLDQVLTLVEQLSSDQRNELRRKLDDKSWGDDWRKLEEEIEQNRVAKGLPPMTEEEVYQEFTNHRQEQKGKGCSKP
jgi:hypothetical protein